jgi:FMN-dependent NADH-azoreductase
MKILHVSCSPRGQAAESDRLAQKIIGYLRRSATPAASLITRVVAAGGISPIDNDYAVSQQASADVSEAGSAAHSDELIQELESADFVVIGTPVHNFTVPAALKLWIDHVVRVRRTFNVSPQGKLGTLRDRPVFVAVSSGGRYSGERSHQPDFLTPYLKAIFGIIGLRDLTFFAVQGTAFGAEAVAAARAQADRELQAYFASFCPYSFSSVLPPHSPAAVLRTSATARP